MRDFLESLVRDAFPREHDRSETEQHRGQQAFDSTRTDPMRDSERVHVACG